MQKSVKRSRKSIIILGMHRSGTSALARTLNLCGVDIGNNLMPPGIEDNEKGFWEHMDIYNANEKLLHNFNSTWDDIRALPDRWWDSGFAEAYKLEIISILKRDFSNSPFWGIKDPRICRFLPVWYPLLEQTGSKPYFLIIIRNPLEVVSSLAKRNGFSKGKSCLLWLRNLIESEKGTRNSPRIFVTYEELLSNWRGLMSRVQRFFGFRWPNSLKEAEPEINAFLENSMRHNKVMDSDLIKDKSISKWIKDAYLAVIDTIGNEDGRLIKTLDAIETKLKETDILYDPAFTDIWEKYLNNNDRLQERNQAVSILTAQLAEQKEENKKLMDEVDELRQSTSWKITAPLRWCSPVVRNVASEIRKVVINIIRSVYHMLPFSSSRKNRIKGWCYSKIPFLFRHTLSYRLCNEPLHKEIQKRTESLIDSVNERVLKVRTIKREYENSYFHIENEFEIPNSFTQNCTIKFSIIIPCYTILNRYLIDLIDILNKQSYKNYEIYIIGNKSCSLIDIINDRKIKYINTNTESWHTITNLLLGDYIIFINQKDYLTQDALYCVAKELNINKDTVDILYGCEPNGKNKIDNIDEDFFEHIDSFSNSQLIGFGQLIVIRKHLLTQINHLCYNNIFLSLSSFLMNSNDITVRCLNKIVFWCRPLPGSRGIVLFPKNVSDFKHYCISLPLKVTFDARLIQRKITGTERYMTELLNKFSKWSNRANITINALIYEPLNIDYDNIDKELSDHRAAISNCDIFHKTFQVGDIRSLKELLLAPAFAFTIHDLISYNNAEYFQNQTAHSLYCKINKVTSHLADRIIAISEHNSIDIQKSLNVPSKNIQRIYHAVSEKFNSESYPISQNWRKTIDIPDMYLLFIGTNYPHKNLINFLKAYQKVMLEINKIKIVIVGAKYYEKPQYELDCKMKELSSYIVDIGHFPEEHLVNLYKQAHALVYPSLYEGFGLPLLEAMKLGLPILASNFSSIPEVVGNGALIVDTTNIEQFADGLIQICNNKILRTNLIEEGYKREAKFNWEKTAFETIQVYYDAFYSALNEGELSRQSKQTRLISAVFPDSAVVFIVTHVKFFPCSAGNEIRIYKLIKQLKNKGYIIAVLYCPLDEAMFNCAEQESIKNYVDYLYQIPYRVRNAESVVSPVYNELQLSQEKRLANWEHVENSFFPKAAVIKADEIIQQLSPQIVIAEYIWTSRVLKMVSANTLKLIDLHDKFSDKDEKVCSFGINDSLSISEQEEVFFLNRADVAIAIQPAEADSFNLLNPKSEIISTGIDIFPVDYTFSVSDNESAKIILIVASGNQLNLFSVEKFINEIWPEIYTTLPDCTLRIVGPICEQLSLNYDGVELAGYVEDITAEYKKASVVINPVVAGTGLKVKSMEALAYGKALVSTPAGVQGLTVDERNLFLIAHSNEDFVRDITGLLNDTALRNKFEINAYKYAGLNLGSNVIYKTFNSIIDDFLLYGKSSKLNILCIFVRYGKEKYPDSLDVLNKWHKNNLKKNKVTIWIVDNILEDDIDSFEKGYRLLSGDNQYWEFSGWEKTINKHKDELQQYDVIHFVTDAFNTLYAGYLDDFCEEHLDFVSRNSVCLGHIDCYDESIRLFEHSSKHWIRSCFFFISPKTLKLIDGMVALQDIDKTAIFDNTGKFINDLHLSDNYIDYITHWLSGKSIQGTCWHSTITGNNHFQDKTMAILREHMLSINMRERKIHLIDFCWSKKFLNSNFHSRNTLASAEEQVAFRNIQLSKQK